MLRLAMWLCHNRSEAEDLVQETTERALRNAERLKPDSDLYGWVTKVMTNAFLDACRWRKVRAAAHERLRFEMETSYTLADEVREEYDGVTAEDVFEEARSINPTNRSSFELRHRDGRTYEEIARILGINLNTVKTHIRRARDELAERFGRKGGRNHVS